MKWLQWSLYGLPPPQHIGQNFTTTEPPQKLYKNFTKSSPGEKSRRKTFPLENFYETSKKLLKNSPPKSLPKVYSEKSLQKVYNGKVKLYKTEIF